MRGGAWTALMLAVGLLARGACAAADDAGDPPTVRAAKLGSVKELVRILRERRESDRSSYQVEFLFYRFGP